MKNSFNALSTLNVNGKSYDYYDINQIPNVDRLPYSLKILLENLLRYEDGKTVTRQDIEFLSTWRPKEKLEKEIAYRPARVLLQDFTGVPAIVDLAAMRDAMITLKGNPDKN